MWWPRLENKIKEIIKNYKEESHEEERTERDILEELLELTRMTAKRIPRRGPVSRHALEMLIHGLDKMTMRILDFGNKESYILARELFNDELFESLEMLCMEFDAPLFTGNLHEIRNRIVHGLR